jgi:hypothetical protein
VCIAAWNASVAGDQSSFVIFSLQSCDSTRE